MANRSEREKMLAGELYDPRDRSLAAERRRARLLLHRFNTSRDDEQEERSRVLAELIPNAGSGLFIEPPFFCDYGENIVVGDNVYFNFNCTVLDVALVTIGSRVLFGPAAQLYAATHPLDATERRSGLELGAAITIGDDAWIGGGAIILPGVTIGSRTIIGAGSVVTKDIPSDVLAAGNPCRIIRG